MSIQVPDAPFQLTAADLEKYVFEFDSIEEFSLVVSASCDNVTKENAKNVIEKLLSKNGKSLNDKFCLTLTTT